MGIGHPAIDSIMELQDILLECIIILYEPHSHVDSLNVTFFGQKSSLEEWNAYKLSLRVPVSDEDSKQDGCKLL